MSKLDDKSFITSLDKKNLDVSLRHFTDQCKQGWEEVMKLDMSHFKDIKQIDCYAMGGSRLGAVIMSYVFRNELKVPFNYYASYDIPAYVNENTLAIVVSNSGSTEETLSSYEQAKNKTKNILGITTGGKLGEMLKQDGHLIYSIDDKEFNPSSVPRVAVGFQLGAFAAIVKKVIGLQLEEVEFMKILAEIKAKVDDICIDSETEENPAKQLSQKIQGKIAVIISAEHLFGAGNVINNQTNESGKNFSCFFELPEVNHHQLEGMEFPKSNPDNLIYLLLESELYHPRVSKRFEILKTLLDDLGIQHESYKPTSGNKLGQALEAVQFGGYFTYYLGLLNEVDPAPNPFVDKFKQLLNK
jgi:glucose/mannose-6-phosphate isomerase